MRISDWSSDVCSSDLARHDQAHQAHDQEGAEARQVALRGVAVKAEATECGRACKEGRSDRRARVNEEDRRQRQAHRHGIGPVNALGCAFRQAIDAEARSEERRVGKDSVRTCRYRWAPSHSKKKEKNT